MSLESKREEYELVTSEKDQAALDLCTAVKNGNFNLVEKLIPHLQIKDLERQRSVGLYLRECRCATTLEARNAAFEKLIFVLIVKMDADEICLG
ncbi:MAG: hypothetical protein WCJ29_04465 [bacterium]